MLESPVPVRIKEMRERRWWGECWDCCVTSAVGSRRCTERRVESRNIVEYETAARHALACGRGSDRLLLTMAEVEWEHEKYFRSCVLRHRWAKRVSILARTTAKETIRIISNGSEPQMIRIVCGLFVLVLLVPGQSRRSKQEVGCSGEGGVSARVEWVQEICVGTR